MLKEHITHSGAMSVSEYMSLALTHPDYGYYRRRNPLGTEGDFTTAPEISQLFGEMIGVWLATSWKQMGSPTPFNLVELGAGKGTLMADILRATRHVDGFRQHVTLHIIEINEPLKAAQRELLTPFELPIEWHEQLDTLPPAPTLFITNEFFDALPIQQYVYNNGEWRERHVGLTDEGELCFCLSPDVLPAEILADKLPNHISDGAVYEHCPQAIIITRHIARHIKQHGGAGLFIDYGYYSPEYQDSLQAVKAHQYHPVLETPGEADLTAHVDFGRLMQEAQRINIRAQGHTTQASFLKAMGIEIRAHMLSHHANAHRSVEIESGLKRLIAPEEMGTLFKCMAFTHPDNPPAYGFPDLHM